MTDISFCPATMCPLFAADDRNSAVCLMHPVSATGVAGSIDRFVRPVSWQLVRLRWPRLARALCHS